MVTQPKRPYSPGAPLFAQRGFKYGGTPYILGELFDVNVIAVDEKKIASMYRSGYLTHDQFIPKPRAAVTQAANVEPPDPSKDADGAPAANTETEPKEPPTAGAETTDKEPGAAGEGSGTPPAPPVAPVDDGLDAMLYKDLRLLAKEKGVSAMGSADDIRIRLRNRV